MYRVFLAGVHAFNAHHVMTFARWRQTHAACALQFYQLTTGFLVTITG